MIPVTVMKYSNTPCAITIMDGTGHCQATYDTCISDSMSYVRSQATAEQKIPINLKLKLCPPARRSSPQTDQTGPDGVKSVRGGGGG